MDKHYTVSDGRLMLYLWPAEEGGYNVTSPMDPALITQAETIEEAFVMAYDAQECLREARAKLARELGGATSKRGKARAATPPTTTSQSEEPAALPKPTRKQTRKIDVD